MGPEAGAPERFFETTFRLFYSLAIGFFRLIKPSGPNLLIELRRKAGTVQAGPYTTAIVMWTIFWGSFSAALDPNYSIPDIVSGLLQFFGLGTRRSELVPFSILCAALSVGLFEVVLRARTRPNIYFDEVFSSEDRQQWIEKGLYIWAQTAVYFWVLTFIWGIMAYALGLKAESALSTWLLAFTFDFSFLLVLVPCAVKIAHLFAEHKERLNREILGWSRGERRGYSLKQSRWKRRWNVWMKRRGGDRAQPKFILSLRQGAKGSSQALLKRLPFGLVKPVQTMARQTSRAAARLRKEWNLDSGGKEVANQAFLAGFIAVGLPVVVVVLVLIIFRQGAPTVETNYSLCYQDDDGSIMAEVVLSNNSIQAQTIDVRSIGLELGATPATAAGDATAYRMRLSEQPLPFQRPARYKVLEPGGRLQLRFKAIAEQTTLIRIDQAMRLPGRYYRCRVVPLSHADKNLALASPTVALRESRFTVTQPAEHRPFAHDRPDQPLLPR